MALLPLVEVLRGQQLENVVPHLVIAHQQSLPLCNSSADQRVMLLTGGLHNESKGTFLSRGSALSMAGTICLKLTPAMQRHMLARIAGQTGDRSAKSAQAGAPAMTAA